MYSSIFLQALIIFSVSSQRIGLSIDEINNNDSNDELLNSSEIDIQSNISKVIKKNKDPFKFDQYITHSYDLNRLRQSLIYSYDKLSRPVINSSDPVIVKLGVNVAQINGLDEDFQVRFNFKYKRSLS